MLLRFSITNHRSLRNRRELSLVASSLDGPTDGLIHTGHVPGGRVLPVALVYGTNASGKTNLIRAFRWVRDVVTRSHAEGGPGRPLPVDPFALEPAMAEAPTEFDVDFIEAGVRYHYGFNATRTAFTEEWLFAYPKDRRQMLFERRGQTFTFGRHLKGRNQTIAELTRPDSLFLSAAVLNNHDELTTVAGFFRRQWFAPMRGLGPFTAEPASLPDDRVTDFLVKVGTGVTGFRFKEVEAVQLHFPLEGLRPSSPASRPTDASENQGAVPAALPPVVRTQQRLQMLQMAHRGPGGQETYFNYDDESEGTQRLIDMLPRVFEALSAGSFVMIDELDASLHTRACELVVGLFSSPLTNPNGAQLIATTHDTKLLESPLLRRDQIWLTEKDPEGVTNLYPITDFPTRKTDNLERGYLEGRFGAVPFAGDVRDVLSTL